MESEAMSMPGWARALAITGGILSLIAGFLILVFPSLGVLIIAYFLAFALIMLGTERLVIGVTGHAGRVKRKAETQTA